MHETGLGHLSGVHLMAATPEIALGCEFYHAKYYVREDILTDIFPINNGYVKIPDNPGLGMKPDLEKIEKLTIRKSARQDNRGQDNSGKAGKQASTPKMEVLAG